jgi:restriction system protein
MPIPDFEKVKPPALKLLGDGLMRPLREVYNALSDLFSITPEERAELLPSGTQLRWNNRVNWACYDLYKAGLLDRPKRGHYKINDLGLKVLGDKPANLDRAFLRQFAGFQAWDKGVATTEGTAPAIIDTEPSTQTANERLEAAFEEMQSALKQDLLDIVRKMDPYAFEQLVVDLLVAMGYGGSRAEAAQVTQRSADEGIDGVIKEDRLGLETIYLQAKRWQSAVGRKELQAFVGALAGQGASKGVFITSGEFANTANEYVEKISQKGQKVVLIDGDRMASLMIEHGVGVSPIKTYALKRVDSDYFESE